MLPFDLFAGISAVAQVLCGKGVVGLCREGRLNRPLYPTRSLAHK